MNSVDFILEVEDVDEVVLIGRLLLFWNSFGKDLGILVEVHDRLIASWLPIKSVRTRFVHPYPSAFSLIRNLGLLDQCLYQVLNGSSLRYQQVKLFLERIKG